MRESISHVPRCDQEMSYISQVKGSEWLSIHVHYVGISLSVATLLWVEVIFSHIRNCNAYSIAGQTLCASASFEIVL